jgi:hypothetical protein
MSEVSRNSIKGRGPKNKRRLSSLQLHGAFQTKPLPLGKSHLENFDDISAILAKHESVHAEPPAPR